jgi:hypothetical protein
MSRIFCNFAKITENLICPEPNHAYRHSGQESVKSDEIFPSIKLTQFLARAWETISQESRHLPNFIYVTTYFTHRQGCQIFLGTKYQNEEKYTKLPRTLPNVKKTVKWTKCPYNIPSSSIARSSKIYPNWDFWFENKPSGNPAHRWNWITIPGANPTASEFTTTTPAP